VERWRPYGPSRLAKYSSSLLGLRLQMSSSPPTGGTCKQEKGAQVRWAPGQSMLQWCEVQEVQIQLLAGSGAVYQLAAMRSYMITTHVAVHSRIVAGRGTDASVYKPIMLLLCSKLASMSPFISTHVALHHHIPGSSSCRRTGR
jgi:hypothetical protein